MLFSIISLAAGLVLLLFAGDLLVKGAVGLSENLGIPPLVIGLTVVAFGTSAPELVVSVGAALSGAPGIAVGNIVGSNIANVLLVIGLPALFAPVAATETGMRRNVTVMLGLTLLFMFLLSNGVIGRLEGALLFAGLCGFVARQVWVAQKSQPDPAHDFHEEVGPAPHDPKRVGAYLLIGLVGLPIAAHLTVTGAVGIAERFGISDTVIGLTVVAIGTSLPELATTLMAGIRRNSAVAVGNVVGSNIFNVACIMGLTALIKPVPVDHHFVAVDMWVMLASAALLALLAYARVRAGKMVGIAMLAAYAVYMFAILDGV